MIKVKMIELLNIVIILNKICNCDDKKVSMQFKFKTGMLNQDLMKYVTQYYKELQKITNENEIKIIENQFVNEDEIKLNKFLQLKKELENMDLELNQSKIIFDENFNNISWNELMIIKPFFDYSQLEGEVIS